MTITEIQEAILDICTSEESNESLGHRWGLSPIAVKDLRSLQRVAWSQSAVRELVGYTIRHRDQGVVTLARRFRVSRAALRRVIAMYWTTVAIEMSRDLASRIGRCRQDLETGIEYYLMCGEWPPMPPDTKSRFAEGGR